MHVAGNVPRSVQIVSAALPHIGKVIGSWIRAAADPRWCALCGFSNPAGCSGALSPTDGGFHDPCTTSTFRLTDAKRRQFISNGCHLLGVIFYCRDRDLSNKMQIANKPSTGNETSR
ncbi:hypothetical protein BDA96_01G351800 [Sorghum bicolor]|uniref:Uncharacterized protein n=1 Tax=Sorghum bicolor TaxID=4558 RepID=A0A921UZN5_SORBI|nr:uncharacterized protein LOC110431362 isoform X2 [Sorghum bicolor]KAG0550599.1 hypothetical protein BDA96_01G351800 [Sorghum bicolor]|eukprot:XP_021306111.1 uncharacterized protein LOC110431362 isoform X2 [Sorghum bicolor]